MEITSYFDKSSTKKRELSEQSNNGDEPKKLRDDGSQTDSSSGWDDVFLQGLSSDETDSPVLKFMKRLEAQLKDLHQVTVQTKLSQIKGEEHLSEVSKSIEFISKRFDEYEKELKEKDDLIKALRSEVDDMSEEIDTLKLGLDRQEQYSRRNCLLFHNIPEKNGENTDEIVVQVVNEKMGETISVEDLDRSHRLGARKEGKSRPVIVKFSRYITRNKIFRNKKVLKGKQISITESLTGKRMSELSKAREKFGFKSVWTSDGKILYKDETENKIKVFYD